MERELFIRTRNKVIFYNHSKIMDKYQFDACIVSIIFENGSSDGAE